MCHVGDFMGEREAERKTEVVNVQRTFIWSLKGFGAHLCIPAVVKYDPGGGWRGWSETMSEIRPKSERSLERSLAGNRDAETVPVNTGYLIISENEFYRRVATPICVLL